MQYSHSKSKSESFDRDSAYLYTLTGEPAVTVRTVNLTTPFDRILKQMDILQLPHPTLIQYIDGMHNVPRGEAVRRLMNAVYDQCHGQMDGHEKERIAKIVERVGKTRPSRHPESEWDDWLMLLKESWPDSSSFCFRMKRVVECLKQQINTPERISTASDPWTDIVIQDYKDIVGQYPSMLREDKGFLKSLLKAQNLLQLAGRAGYDKATCRTINGHVSRMLDNTP